MAAIEDLIAEIERSYEELNAQLADPDMLGDRAHYADTARKHAVLQQVYTLAQQYREAEQTVADAEGLIGDDTSDAEMRDFAQDELQDGRRRLDEIAEEIRVRTGGNEACIFAGELARMYTRYAEAKDFVVEVLNANENDDGGFKEITLEVKGQGAYSALKYEGGVHRVQRVPVTEAAGRIHTSTATVAVLPEAEDIEVDIHAGDLRIDIFRARGPGGQSVNTTDSAVRMTHVPTGISVSCQDEKSQLQNKERALRILRARLFEAKQAAQDEERGEARRSMVGSGDRSQKIRTYNFQQNRVSDHRIGLTSHRLTEVMEGDLDEFTEALAAEDRRKQLAAAGAG